MPRDHGTHRDFIAPWARAVEACSGGRLRVTVHDGDSPLGRLAQQHAQVFYFVMNRARYEGLDGAAREAIDAASGPGLAARFGDWWEAWSRPAREAARERGDAIVDLAPAEYQRWARAARPAVDRWIGAIEAEGVAEARAIHAAAAALAGNPTAS